MSQHELQEEIEESLQKMPRYHVSHWTKAEVMYLIINTTALGLFRDMLSRHRRKFQAKQEETFKGDFRTLKLFLDHSWIMV